MKYLIWAAVLYFAWRWYLSSKNKAAPNDDGVRRSSDGSDGGNSASSTSSTNAADTSSTAASLAEGAADKMVACAHCGIHLPQSEALHGADRRPYCSEEHRSLHAVS